MAGMYGFRWSPYVPVAVRRARADRQIERLRRKGMEILPVRIEGRCIARTFLGKAWCSHIEGFGDYSNRLPRGRTYIRNGSVCHLDIASGEVNALVMGSEMYRVTVKVNALPRKKWKDIKQRCAGRIGSILELIEGRLSKEVMKVVTHRERGLFPLPGEILLDCTCPDWAIMCKHVAAVLYGVGARLDEKPELLFLLRGVNHEELITAGSELARDVGKGNGREKRLAAGGLSEIFGIEVIEGDDPESPPAKTAGKAGRPSSTGKKGKGGPKTRRSKRGRPAGRPPAAENRRRTSPPKSAARRGRPRRSSRLPSERYFHRRKPPMKRPAVTGEDVVRLRDTFAMTRREFALLMGLSESTVYTWEKTPGPIRFQERTGKAWKRVSRLNMLKAWRILEKL